MGTKKTISVETYVTTYCNFPHRMNDGAPIGHECYVIPPSALRAERDGDTQKAIDIVRDAKPLRRHTGTRNLQRVCANCANCRATLPWPYGTPGVSLARFDNKTLLCSECGTAEAFSNQGAIAVSKWFNDNIDSHTVYQHREIARKFLRETGQLADWPVATYKETLQSMRNDPRGGTLERGLEGSLVCYGWIMTRHMAAKLVNHHSHMMGRGFEFRDCVDAMAKGGY